MQTFWSSRARAAPVAPLRSGLRLLLKESRSTEVPDRALWRGAPELLVGLVLAALAVLPLAPDLIGADLSVGVVYAAAASVTPFRSSRRRPSITTTETKMLIKAYLLTAAALISVGLWGALSQMSIVMVMMGLELMLNGVLLSVVTFWHFVAPFSAKGQVFGIIVLTLMAVEAAMGFAMVIAVYRGRQADTVDAVSDLKG